MSIKLDPNSLMAAAVSAAQHVGIKPPSNPTMAPVSLTPLVPPSVGPLPPNTPVSPSEGGTNDRWRDFFADQQQALLTRLSQGRAESSALPGSSLSVAQRDACIAVLNRIADAVSAAE
jgi:hypothetical protein